MSGRAKNAGIKNLLMVTYFNKDVSTSPWGKSNLFNNDDGTTAYPYAEGGPHKKL